MRRSYLLAPVLGLFLVCSSDAQYPVLDAIANKVIQKYQQSTCEQLWAKKGQPKSPQEQEALQMLRNDPERRAAFIDKVAAPIANKMFECAMIP
jgi:hypothetical protein